QSITRSLANHSRTVRIPANVIANLRKYLQAERKLAQAKNGMHTVDDVSEELGLPVEKVTWEEARAFCRKLSERRERPYRLPTEAEWEMAARAGERGHYATLAEWKEWLNAHAWQSWNAKGKSHPVGELKPNGWGLCDMIGNVEEWTADGYGPYPEEAVTDPAGFENERKVVRGNGWVSSYDFCRYASRSAQAADYRRSTIGFRVVAEAR
ncbi:MAG: SUMF1/EgtB/PvdO family nonheme iron enzyme, partial [Planctomycetes bacterium]|nr:SUMF1/EgtB/PvdO family nonheme iron enzyme [Planctomycetota bacterium]